MVFISNALLQLDLCFRLKCTESVQCFQFDKDGNMFIFPPGSGCTGEPT